MVGRHNIRSYSGDLTLKYPLFLSFHVCFRKGVDSTTIHFNILSPEFKARSACPLSFTICLQTCASERKEASRDDLLSGLQPLAPVMGNFKVGMRTGKSRLQRSLLELRDLMRRMRHLPLEEQVINLNQVLRGDYAYYGIAGNFRALQRVHRTGERY